MLKKFLLLTGVALSIPGTQAMELEPTNPIHKAVPAHPVAPLDNDFWGKDFSVNPAPTIAIERDVTAYYMGKKQKIDEQMRLRVHTIDPIEDLRSFLQSEKFEPSQYAILVQEAADYKKLFDKRKKIQTYCDSFCDLNWTIKELMEDIKKEPSRFMFECPEDLKTITRKNLHTFPFTRFDSLKAERKTAATFVDFLQNQLEAYNFLGIKGHSTITHEKISQGLNALLKGTTFEDKAGEILSTVKKIQEEVIQTDFNPEKIKTAIFVIEKFVPKFLSTLKAVHKKATEEAAAALTRPAPQ